jgi:citrate synthase
MSDNPLISETRRADRFASRPVTRIWQETPSPDNPYVADGARCHGYDLFELLERARFCEVLFLLFRGELPTAAQTDLLERWWLASINPGPRHPATRAALNAGVGKTNAASILPIGLTVLGGDHLGATEVKRSMRFLAAHVAEDPNQIASRLLGRESPPARGDWHVAAGFGSRFGGIDHLARRIGERLAALAGAGPALRWAQAFAAALEAHNLSWLDPGIAAAVALDLGFSEYAAIGLYQLSRAPGLLAHGVEMIGQPLTAMPFLGDESYIHE